MNKYELALVLRPDLDEETKTAELQKVQDLIARFEGTVEKVDDWGKRRLAYEIQKVNEGFYTFITFTAKSSTPAEIESRVRIMENVLRYLIVRVEG
ncbi:MAG: 30S ribosomal protein S6 [Clostridia bacterium]|jgi:small subunit ribosomal protein S6|nr:30S ribosomal protein S6 [Clostridia bacterium]MCI1999981.1 30S ribosomal protein S6 [Clostridia bacterium]MCI2014485.1 30S ribosomal protein S6 [Clostridia bacterium]